MRPSKRLFDQLRPVRITTNVNKYAEGSCMIEMGNTRVLCTASVEKRVPFFRRNSGLGWVTAEYAMLPRATSERNRRDGRGRMISGRTQEIQRLIGRALRAGIDFSVLGERQVIVDCDVLQADGGTRCAAVTGGWVALKLAMQSLLRERVLRSDPVIEQLAAVSCGVYAGTALLDLEYSEDSEADLDGNFVMTASRKFVEIQCSAEEDAFSRNTYDKLLSLAEKGVDELLQAQTKAVSGVSP
ncbi:MAG: ribonuclease PH [Rhodobacteraceae bacterium]|nr:ribonuclease PH [Paracoccaceae bacterium]